MLVCDGEVKVRSQEAVGDFLVFMSITEVDGLVYLLCQLFFPLSISHSHSVVMRFTTLRS